MAVYHALRQHLPAGCHVAEPQGGYFLWVTLPAHVDATQLAQRCSVAPLSSQVDSRERSDETSLPAVTFVPGGAFSAAHGHCCRFSCAMADPEQIDAGVRRFCRELSSLLLAPKP